MKDSAEKEAGPDRSRAGRPARVTTIRKATTIAVVLALLVGGASSLATARLTDRQSDLDKLASQVSQQEAQIAQLSSQVDDGAADADRLNAEITTLNGKIFDLEAAKLSLEDQLSHYVNPAPGPVPTAALTAIWVGLYNGYSVSTVVCVEIENTSESDLTVSYSYSQFSAIDADNFVYPPKAGSEGYGIRIETPLMSGQLGPGEKRRGELWYDVPVQAILARLVWDAGVGTTPEIIIDLPAAGTYPNQGLPPRLC